MIEILISILVMSIALLALAAMQTRMLSDSSSSKFRQIATSQAASIADSMRANPSAVMAGSFNNGASTVVSNCLTSTGCTSTEMASTMLGNWLDQLGASLPSGSGVVCIDSSPNDGTPAAPACDGLGTLYVIKVWWYDNKIDPTVAQRFVTVFLP